MSLFKLFGPSDKPLKYSSAPTRYASLHDFQNGAEINEEHASIQQCPGSNPDNFWNMNIRSGVNKRDTPSKHGLIRGMDRIGHFVITPDNIEKTWIRRRGEPID